MMGVELVAVPIFRKQMPAVRDVVVRFIAPACRPYCTLGDVHKLLP